MAITDLTYESLNPPANITEDFYNMSKEQIREATRAGRSELVNVCMNLTSDFNKATIIRSSNAFLCRAVYLVGKRKFDRRGAVGMYHYEELRHADTLEEVVAALKADGYTVYAVDNTPSFEPTAVYDVELPSKSAFVYGEENAGLSEESLALCDAAVYIPQRGVVRSLNVGSAASVMMSEYSRQHRLY